ncbi:RraA family protein [Sulfitobacter geojensis]|uniref:RraA family protein n=1 Tax=Sulfitobacter geojensis TaxID=1342299 RepID=A0AAE3B7D5_9RHOB|nr:RraA family protein [Sulfitobacter geojensis]MBM1690109.1 RraA family protein [Sulfitobacter geojensis]MBM1694175.1 RraA family protein [Sulfitobacter geojensis]MBM1706341.1 RraA family protein [Sulfitobacter geojensis]MBM1710399.1 RraA family protein [Sulfitobacter geojensis]MBM1714465.1 RraA family protein [Sulfitobacter geojensis]
MNDSLFDLLKRVDTPTVCNAIEVAQGKRGFDAFTRGTMFASGLDGVMVGYARTARIAAVTPPSEPPEVIKARRMAYYKYMSLGPRPAVAVVQDTDVPNAIGAFWGEINTNVHKAFGLTGALTNGVMRDLGDLPDGFTVVAGSVGPSHGFVHVIDFDTPVEVMGMRVAPGSLIHADRHGAVVIPDDVIPRLEAAIAQLFKSEKVVLDATKGKRIGFAEFETAWAAFEASRT